MSSAIIYLEYIFTPIHDMFIKWATSITNLESYQYVLLGFFLLSIGVCWVYKGKDFVKGYFSPLCVYVLCIALYCTLYGFNFYIRSWIAAIIFILCLTLPMIFYFQDLISSIFSVLLSCMFVFSNIYNSLFVNIASQSKSIVNWDFIEGFVILLYVAIVLSFIGYLSYIFFKNKRYATLIFIFFTGLFSFVSIFLHPQTISVLLIVSVVIYYLLTLSFEKLLIIPNKSLAQILFQLILIVNIGVGLYLTINR